MHLSISAFTQFSKYSIINQRNYLTWDIHFQFTINNYVLVHIIFSNFPIIKTSVVSLTLVINC